jgi:DMSO/TMAO reductase YedYZ molybdopterin-dependent catalytic subunit
VDQDKLQSDAVPSPQSVPEGVIVSPDTLRANRIPPRQSRTKKWPILDAGGAPHIALENWSLSLRGMVARPITWSWQQIQALPKARVFADFHCVTRWSRLGNLWEGVSTHTLVDLAGGVLPGAKFVLAHGYDSGYTTNLSMDDFLADDALVAFLHDGLPLSLEHGGPARLIVPSLYAWKSAKWVQSLEALSQDQAGFWESNGYHMRGDPWKEERFGE